MAAILVSNPIPAGMIAEWHSNPEALHRSIDHAYSSSFGNIPSSLIQLILDYLKESARVYGYEDWNSLRVRVSPKPAPFPLELERALQQICPFSREPEVKVRDTHRVIYFPEAVNRLPFERRERDTHQVVDFHETLIRVPLTLFEVGLMFLNHFSIDSFGSDVDVQNLAKKSWVLIFDGVIPESVGKRYSDLEAMITTISNRSGINYQIPTASEASIAFLTSYHKETLLFNKIVCSDSLDIDKRSKGRVPPDGYEKLNLTAEQYAKLGYYKGRVTVQHVTKKIRPDVADENVLLLSDIDDKDDPLDCGTIMISKFEATILPESEPQTKTQKRCRCTIS